MTQTRHDRDEGIVLVIAMVFMVCMGLVMAGLTTLVINNLSATHNLQADRAAQYAAEGAVDTAIQRVRYKLGGVVYGYNNGAACPIYTTSGAAITNGVAIKVVCEGQLPNTLTTERDVRFTACLASAGNCAAAALIVAVVRFADDSSGPGQKSTVLVWDSSPTTDPGALSISQVSPNAVSQGAATKTLTITGSGFTSPATTGFSGSGVTVVSTSVTNATTLSVIVTINALASTGSRDVSVQSGGNNATCQACFAVLKAPAITALTPASRGQGAKNQTITVTGNNFIDGSSLSMSITGNSGGVTVNSTTYVSTTTLTLNIKVDKNAAVKSDYGATLTNGDGGTASCTSCFAVTTGPKITSITPTGAGRGTSNLTVTVNGTTFDPTVDLTFSNSGVTVASKTVSSTKITAKVNVSNSATVGNGDVTVTNTDGGSDTCTNCFAVRNPKITLSPVHLLTSPKTIQVTATGFAPNTQLTCAVDKASPANCVAPSKTDANGDATFSFVPATGTQSTYRVSDGTNEATADFDVAPAPTGVVFKNGGTVNKVDAGDRIIISWSAQLDPNSVCVTNWAISVSPVTFTMRLHDAGSADTLVAQNKPCGGVNGGQPLNLGAFSLGDPGWTTKDVDFTGSQITYCPSQVGGLCGDSAVAGPALVIQLGTPSNAFASAVSSPATTPTYSPSTGIKTPSASGAFAADADPYFGAEFPTTGGF